MAGTDLVTEVACGVTKAEAPDTTRHNAKIEARMDFMVVNAGRDTGGLRSDCDGT
jgi:hypothetical protein